MTPKELAARLRDVASLRVRLPLPNVLQLLRQAADLLEVAPEPAVPMTWTFLVDGHPYRHVIACDQGWIDVLVFDERGELKREPDGKPCSVRITGKVIRLGDR